MRAALAPAAALLCAACSYDLDVLRGRDAGADARRPDASGDVATPDVAPPDAPADRPAPDVAPPDAGPSRDASMGSCMGRDASVLGPEAGGAIGGNGVVTVEGNTIGGEAAVAGCEDMQASPMSTRVYRYVVEAGPRLVATTNTGLCGTGAAASHDTILGAYFNCGAGGLVPGPRSCVDDDRVNVCEGMAGCASNGGLGCGNAFSTLELSGLVRGDVVYFAVSSYPAMGLAPRGPFRLSVAENGLSPAALPTGGTPAVNGRCTCPASAPMSSWTVRVIEFPRTGVANQLNDPRSRAVFANLPVGLRQVWGVSGSFRLSSFSVSNQGTCVVSGGATAVLDVIVNTVVASVTLGVYIGAGGAVTIPLTTFTPLVFDSPTATPTVQYRIRNVQPADTTCISLDIDLTAPNTLTLYGAM